MQAASTGISPYILPGLMIVRRNIEDTIHMLMYEMKITDINILKTKTRIREVVSKRQIMMHLLRYYGFTTIEIGRYFNADHATVIHSAKTVENDMITDRDLRAFITRIKGKSFLFQD